MPIEPARLRAVLALLGLGLAMQLAAALHPARNHHDAGRIARSCAARLGRQSTMTALPAKRIHPSLAASQWQGP